MSEKIVEGYLINKFDFQIFDEIIVFLSNESVKYTCISLGSKKIISKNSRNLFLGCKIEFQFFQARSEEKMSRLKKVNLIEEYDWQIQSNKCIFFLNEMILNLNYSPDLFTFYENKLNEIKKHEIDDNTFILISLKEFCLRIGISLEVNKCINCGTKILKTISFKHGGMLCNICAQEEKTKFFDIRFSKLIFELSNDFSKNLHNYYDLYPFAIKLLRDYIFDQAGIKLNSLNDY